MVDKKQARVNDALLRCDVSSFSDFFYDNSFVDDLHGPLFLWYFN